jgi:hypothetical protein
MSSLILEVHQFTRQTPQIEDIRGCVQRRWTLALYSVSTVLTPLLSSATSPLSSTARSFSIPFPMGVQWRWSGGWVHVPYCSV